MISVVIPFYNEEENIALVATALRNFAQEKGTDKLEVVFVDDGSSDKSLELVKKESWENIKAKIVKLSRNFGSHAALRAGIEEAGGDYIVTLNADLQDSPDVVRKMHAECLKGRDIVWAVRRQGSTNIVEALFSKVYSLMMRRLVISTYPQRGVDMVMFSRRVQGILKKNVESNSSLFLQLLLLGFSQVFIDFERKRRLRGASKWKWTNKLKLFIDSFVAFSYVPIRLVTFIGIVLFVAGIIWSFYLIIRKFVFDDLRSGWPALISIIAIGFGTVNISLGIIAEYLWRTLDAARKRPVFIVEDVFDIEKSKK